MSPRFTFTAEVWAHGAGAAWRFVTVPKAESGRIRTLSEGLRNAFGSLRVVARIGKTSWRTSVFADTKSGCFLLPVKAEVRRNEKVGDGDKIRVTLEIEL